MHSSPSESLALFSLLEGDELLKSENYHSYSSGPFRLASAFSSENLTS